MVDQILVLCITQLTTKRLDGQRLHCWMTHHRKPKRFWIWHRLVDLHAALRFALRNSVTKTHRSNFDSGGGQKVELQHMWKQIFRGQNFPVSIKSPFLGLGLDESIIRRNLTIAAWLEKKWKEIPLPAIFCDLLGPWVFVPLQVSESRLSVSPSLGYRASSNQTFQAGNYKCSNWFHNSHNQIPWGVCENTLGYSKLKAHTSRNIWRNENKE